MHRFLYLHTKPRHGFGLPAKRVHHGQPPAPNNLGFEAIAYGVHCHMLSPKLLRGQAADETNVAAKERVRV